MANQGFPPGSSKCRMGASQTRWVRTRFDVCAFRATFRLRERFLAVPKAIKATQGGPARAKGPSEQNRYNDVVQRACAVVLLVFFGFSLIPAEIGRAHV